MDLTGNSDVDTTAAALAARAEDAARALYQRTAGQADEESITDTDEVHRMLGSLKLVVENLARCLPELNTWLEQRMWSGTLGKSDDASFDELTKSTFDVAAALARAHRMSAQLGRELQAAQTASRELAAKTT